MSESEFCAFDSADYLKKLLEIRDEKEKLPYENLIYTINEYVSELESALILVDSMKMSLKRSRLTGETGGNSNGGNSSLEVKLKELKEERGELYRQQGIQATHLLSLNDQLRLKDTLITTQLTEISQLKAEQERKEDEMKKLKEKLREGEEGAKIIGDELVTLQLELLRLDQWQNKSKTEGGKLNENLSIESNVSLNISTKISQLKLTKEKEIIAPHQYPISSYTSHPTTRQLLTGSEDQKIILYDLTRISTKMVLKWSKMNGPIVALAFDEEGKVAASCSAYDKEVTIWNLTNGKIQSTLQFSDDSNDSKIAEMIKFLFLHFYLHLAVPLLKFGPQFRLWMSLGRSVRLWDVQRGLLLRSWSRELINQNIQIILPDAKRPDRLWCIDEKGAFAVLNAVTGKLEFPWKPITNMEIHGVLLYDCSVERIVLARVDDNDKDDWIITGYGRNQSALDGIFEFNLKSDLKCCDSLRNISIHPDRSDLLALILDTSVLIVKVSQDNWNPETLLLQDCRCDTIQWGPEEDDPINGERGCKIVLVDKESKKMKLFTLSSI